MKFPAFVHSLRFKLIAASLAIEIAVMAVLVSNGLRLIDQHLTEQVERRITAVEAAYKTALAVPLAARDFATVRDILDGWRFSGDVIYLVVMSPDGRRLAASGLPDEAQLPALDQQAAMATVRHVRFRVEALGQHFGDLQYGMSLDFLETARRELIVQGALIALGGVLLTTLVLALAGYWLTRHLVALANASTQVAAGNYRMALPPPLDDEIGLLSRNFSAMAQAVESRIEELANQTARQAAIFNALGEGIYGLDAGGKCVFVNPAALDMLGFSEEEMLGQNTHRLFHYAHADGTPYPEEECPVHFSVLDGVLRRSLDDAFWRKDGSCFDVALTVSPMSDDGEVSGLVVAFRDISELKKAVEEQRDSNERLLSFINALPDIVVLKDGDNRWLATNRATEEMLELQGGDWIGRDSNQLALDRPAFSAFYKMSGVTDEAAWRSGGINLSVEQIGANDGELRTCEVRKMPLYYPDGRRKAMMVIARDITARERAERELEQYRTHLEDLVAERTEALAKATAVAESANVAKSAFLANMSHEIRTPLNAITGMAHLIRRAGISREQGERLDKLEAAGEHLLEIINSVLDISKIEAGKFTLEETRLSVASLLSNIVSMLQARAEAKGVHLMTELDGSIPTQLLGDPTRLQQALLNYVSNGIKFTDEGTVVVRVFPLEFDATSVLTMFEVADSGIGIGNDALGKLFNAFEQADNSTTRRYGGTGLGLAITRRLAEIMGGEAGASSVEGKGSIFWFTARLKYLSSQSAHAGAVMLQDAEEKIRLAHPGKRLMVVEDEPINREIIGLLLDDVGLQVQFAEDGLQALDLADRERFDLILMDMQMPRMDGLEATRRIRRQSRNAETPILALTANAFAEDRLRCHDAGMDDFLAKPVQPESLYAGILTWLEKGATVPAA